MTMFWRKYLQQNGWISLVIIFIEQVEGHLNDSKTWEILIEKKFFVFSKLFMWNLIIGNWLKIDLKWNGWDDEFCCWRGLFKIITKIQSVFQVLEHTNELLIGHISTSMIFPQLYLNYKNENLNKLIQN